MSLTGAVILSSTIMLSGVRANAVAETFTPMHSPTYCLKVVESIVKTSRNKTKDFRVTGESAYDGIVLEYRANGDYVRRELTCITKVN